MARSLIKKENAPTSSLPGRIIWGVAWFVQIALWVLLALSVLQYWLDTVPLTRSYYAAGLEKGMDGLAGVLASADPAWDSVQAVHGHGASGRLTFLQGDTSFDVWVDRDKPAWHAGLGSLTFNPAGKLLWVRRYAQADRYPDMMPDGKTGDLVPIVFAWSPAGREAAAGQDFYRAWPENAPGNATPTAPGAHTPSTADVPAAAQEPRP